jgi:hypothetical protein
MLNRILLKYALIGAPENNINFATLFLREKGFGNEILSKYQ